MPQIIWNFQSFHTSLKLALPCLFGHNNRSDSASVHQHHPGNAQFQSRVERTCVYTTLPPRGHTALCTQLIFAPAHHNLVFPDTSNIQKFSFKRGLTQKFNLRCGFFPQLLHLSAGVPAARRDFFLLVSVADTSGSLSVRAAARTSSAPKSPPSVSSALPSILSAVYFVCAGGRGYIETDDGQKPVDSL